MKKIFSVFVLILGFVLVSCGLNDVPQEKASVDFKIPVADLLLLKNSASREADDTDTETNYTQQEQEQIMKFVVQLVSQDEFNDYSDIKIRTLNLSKIEEELEKKYKALEEKANEWEQMYSGMEQEMMALFAKYGITDPDNMTEAQSVALYSNPNFMADYQAFLQKYGMNSAADYMGSWDGTSEPTDEEIDKMMDDIYDDMGLGDFKSMFNADPYSYLDDYLSFSFPDLEPGNYKIMVDMFHGEIRDKYDDSGKAAGEKEEYVHWTMTGEKTINVVAGRDKSVEVAIKNRYGNGNYSSEPEYFDVEFSYPQGAELACENANIADFFRTYDPVTYDPTDAKYEVVTIDDLIQFQDTAVEGGIWHELKSFDYVLKDDTHFSQGFDISAIKGGDGTPIPIKDGRIALLDILKGFSGNIQIVVSKTVGNESITFDLAYLSVPDAPEIEIDDDTDPDHTSPGVTTPDIDGDDTNTDPDPGTNTDPGTTPPANAVFEEEESGEIEINESKLSFTPWNVTEESKTVRYMTTVTLDSILNGKHLSDGDTVVFILSTEEQASADIFAQYSVDKFYYQLQIDDWANEYKDDDAGLFRNNNCINFDLQDSGQYTFVMPLNLIEDPKDYRNLQLFFDCPKGTDVSSLELNCSVKYSVFPETMKAFVFGVGKNWDDGPAFRYEVNIPLRDLNNQPLELAKGNTVEVYLMGKIRTYENETFTRLDSSTTFTAELYDNAYYEGKDFHALSIDKLDGNVVNPDNVKQLTIGSDGGLENYGQFVFSHIAAPYVSEDEDFKNDFRFQCHTPCTDPEVLLVVTDFYFGNNVTD